MRILLGRLPTWITDKNTWLFPPSLESKQNYVGRAFQNAWDGDSDSQKVTIKRENQDALTLAPELRETQTILENSAL